MNVTFGHTISIIAQKLLIHRAFTHYQWILLNLKPALFLLLPQAPTALSTPALASWSSMTYNIARHVLSQKNVLITSLKEYPYPCSPLVLAHDLYNFFSHSR